MNTEFQEQKAATFLAETMDISDGKLHGTHQSMAGSWVFILVHLLFLTTVDADGFPTYDHPSYKGQLCYKCPPGFYKQADCKYVRGGLPQWPTCVPCPRLQFSQRWNTDGRCWDRQPCEKDQVVIYDGETTGPVKCSCKSSMVEVGGRCVEAVTLKNHTNSLSRAKSDYDRRIRAAIRAITVPPPATMTQQPCITSSQQTCPPCITESIDCGLPDWAIGVLVGVLILLASLVGIIILLRKKLCGLLPCKSSKPSSGTSKSMSQVNANGTSRDEESHSTDVNTGQQDGSNNTQHHQPTIPPPSGNGGQQNGNNNAEDNQPVADAQPTPQPVVVELPPDENTPRMATEEAAKACLVEHAVEGKVGAFPIPDRNSTGTDRSDVEIHDETVHWKEKDPLDEACRIVEHKVFRPADIDSLMRDILDFHSEVCERIKIEGHDPVGQIRSAFKKWRKSKGSAASVGNLVASLQHYEWLDLAEVIADKFNIPLNPDFAGQKQKDTEQARFDKASKICEEMMTTGRNNREFLRTYLQLGGGIMESLPKGGSSVMREGLSKWRRRNGEAANAEELVSLLDEAGDVNVADEIRAKLNLDILGDENETERKVFQEEQSSEKDGAGPAQEHPRVIREMSQPADASPLSTSHASSSGRSSQSSSQAQSSSQTTFLQPGQSQRSDTNSRHVPSLSNQRRGRPVIEQPTSQSTIPIDDGQPGPSHRRGTLEADSSRCTKDCKKEEDSIEVEHIDQTEEQPDQGGKAAMKHGDSEESKEPHKTEQGEVKISDFQQDVKKQNSKKKPK